MSVVYDMGGFRIPNDGEVARFYVPQRPFMDAELRAWVKGARIARNIYLIAFDPVEHRWSKRYYEALRASQAPE